MIVTAHQPNFMPGKSVTDKIAASDGLIWMDWCQYEKGGYTNRNKLPNGNWLTVPLQKHPLHTRIVDIKITSDDLWRIRLINSIRNTYQHLAQDDKLFEVVRRRLSHLTALNYHLFWMMWHTIGNKTPEVQCQSWLQPSGNASEQIAHMVKQMGGTVYLSGPSGKKYLDEMPFLDRGIVVQYWQHEGPNPSILERYAECQLSS